MQTVNIHYAKTHLSRLVEMAARGEPFVIARAGNPLVKVEPLRGGAKPVARRVGFMNGQFVVPEDIKTPFKDEIEAMSTKRNEVSSRYPRPHLAGEPRRTGRSAVE